MSSFLKSTVAAMALTGLGLMTPAMAQSASEMAVRMSQLEEQVRALMGEVEQLNYQVKQLKAQAGLQQSGAAEEMAPAMPQPSRKLAAAAVAPAPAMQVAPAPAVQSDGVEVIETAPLAPATNGSVAAGETDGLGKAPGPQVLGALNNSAAKADDGGFQGKVLVAPGQQEPGDDAFLSQDPGDSSAGNGDSIETVALAPENPETLYERSNESLLRRQFADAEAGFRGFLDKYPDHSLAGSAQYWLGETYYAQSDYRQAAQAFLQGYKKYPKSRRAADSLLKLGISLNRLGQSQQACAAYAAVSTEYPKAVEARKRAQAEAKRAGCQA